MTDYYNGLFWEAEARDESIKCSPPERTWEHPDYLIHYEEASTVKYDLFTDSQLIFASKQAGSKLITDIECYRNYFCICFKCPETKKVIYLEQTNAKLLDTKKLKWIATNFTLVTFMGKLYDEPMLFIAAAGTSCEHLKKASDLLIQSAMSGNDVLKMYEIKRFKIDHVDLKEPAPGVMVSLKLYGGRLNVPMMQDLPFHHDAHLNEKQMLVVLWYCIVIDLNSTELLLKQLKPELELREEMGRQYNLDLRSKSDAQIAEAVINSEIQKLNGYYPKKPDVYPGKQYNYKPPAFLKYHTPLMRWALNLIKNTALTIGGDGKIQLPDVLKELQIPFGISKYQVGIGGLHSVEKTTTHRSDENYVLCERDVVSYYPFVILSTGLYPEQMGKNFLKLYQDIVERRLRAKADGNKIVAESLKITINGSFGKLGNRYSTLYAPHLLIQVTITGQLALLMLIERYEEAALSVISGNTDGIIIKCPRNRIDEMNAIAKQWEIDTTFKTEEARYKILCSRDVNNYIAIKENGEVKGKGSYAKIAASQSGIKTNLENEICITAIEELLKNGTPIEETILNCKDITQFLKIRTVKGGAVKNGNYLGKAIRWYMGKGEKGTIIYASSGNKVPESDGAVPAMRMPDKFPEDLNHKWYIRKTAKMLEEVGYS